MSLVEDLQALQTAVEAAVAEAQASEGVDPTWQALQNVLTTAGWSAPAELPSGEPSAEEVSEA